MRAIAAPASPLWLACSASRRRCPPAFPRTRPSRGRARTPGPTACRSLPRDRTRLARNRTVGRALPGRHRVGKPLRGWRAWPAASACRSRTAGSQPARHCHPPARRDAKSDRPDRRRRINPNSRQALKPVELARKTAPLHDGLRAGMQIASASVVAKARPGGRTRHRAARRQAPRRSGSGLRSARSRVSPPHRGLLEHDLAEPDAIRIRRLARLRAPGQNAAMAIVPGEQRARRTEPALKA